MKNLIFQKARINKRIDDFLKENDMENNDTYRKILMAYASGDMKEAYRLSVEGAIAIDFVTELIDPYIMYCAKSTREGHLIVTDLEEGYEM